MGFRFKKRVKILPGIYYNYGAKSGSSWSIFGYNTRTGKTTVNIPISGLSYQTEGKPRVPASPTTTATIKLPADEMEALKKITGTKSNKQAVLKCIELYLDSQNK